MNTAGNCWVEGMRSEEFKNYGPSRGGDNEVMTLKLKERIETLPPLPTEELELSDDSCRDKLLRPISYLGSKLRSVDSILQVRKKLSRHPMTVLDPFSGSSVVAQAFAQFGDTVIASDAMNMCRDMASATIQGSEGKISSLFETASSVIESPQLSGSDLFQEFVEQEEQLISAGLGSELISFSTKIPQVWRDTKCKPELASLFAQLRKDANREILNNTPVIAAFYAGTYFGVFQALEIDRLWQSILSIQRKGDTDEWVMLSSQVSLSNSPKSIRK